MNKLTSTQASKITAYSNNNSESYDEISLNNIMNEISYAHTMANILLMLQQQQLMFGNLRISDIMSILICLNVLV